MRKEAIQKAVCKERQRLRLHIESLKSTRTGLRKRAKDHRKDIMTWHSARRAIRRLDWTIIREERKLALLEERWRW